MKFPSLLKHNLSITQKIVVAALLMVLAMIFQKVFAINYIAVIPFLRVSLGGPALIILASIWLGPLYGLLVGLGSDVLGYFLLDPKNLSFFPQITAIYALLGFSAYFVFLLIRNIKNKWMFLVEIITMLAVYTFVTVFLFVSKEIKLYSSTYVLELWQKFLIAGILLLLFLIIIIFVYLFNRRHQDRSDATFDAYTISFSCFILELFVMVIFGTVMKGLAFGFFTYPMILVCQIIVLFINIPLNTVLISYLSSIIETNRF